MIDDESFLRLTHLMRGLVSGYPLCDVLWYCGTVDFVERNANDDFDPENAIKTSFHLMQTSESDLGGYVLCVACTIRHIKARKYYEQLFNESCMPVKREMELRQRIQTVLELRQIVKHDRD